VRRDALAGDASEGGEVHAVVQDDGQVLAGQRVLGVGPALHRRDGGPGDQSRVGPRAGGLDCARDGDAADVRELDAADLSLRPVVDALALADIGKVDPDGARLDQHLTGAWYWLGEVKVLENLRAAEAAVLDCFHG
jgi:hypothetical protein